jgi:hypothetical protein
LTCGVGWEILSPPSPGTSFGVRFTDTVTGWACVQVHTLSQGQPGIAGAEFDQGSEYSWTATIPGQPAGLLELSFH